MLDLFMIRHGESVGNLQLNVIGGRFNSVELTTRGHLQATLLGKRFLSENIIFDKVISSSAVRTRQTTNDLLVGMGAGINDVIYSNEILELDQGDWEGAQRDKTYTPKVIAEIIKDHWNFKAPNGESQRDVESRMLRYISETVIDNIPDGKSQIVAMITHAMAIKCTLRGILGSHASMTHKIDIDNTSITRLRFDNKGWHLLCVNDVGHLNSLNLGN